MKRRVMHARSDRRVFSRSARSVKAINVTPKLFRGGIRL